jgi:hypothetical protein
MPRGKKEKEAPAKVEAVEEVEEVVAEVAPEPTPEPTPEPAAEVAPVAADVEIGQMLDTPHDGAGKVIHWDASARVAHVDVIGAIIAVTVP